MMFTFPNNGTRRNEFTRPHFRIKPFNMSRTLPGVSLLIWSFCIIVKSSFPSPFLLQFECIFSRRFENVGFCPPLCSAEVMRRKPGSLNRLKNVCEISNCNNLNSVQTAKSTHFCQLRAKIFRPSEIRTHFGFYSLICSR